MPVSMHCMCQQTMSLHEERHFESIELHQCKQNDSDHGAIRKSGSVRMGIYSVK
jgi:hypothetical protein